MTDKLSVHEKTGWKIQPVSNDREKNMMEELLCGKDT